MADSYTELPGLEGTPYRHYDGDPPPVYRTSDPMSEQPVLRKKMHARVFNLGDKTELQEYNDVMSSLVDNPGKFRLSVERLEWDAAKSAYVAFVRWEERWLERGRKTSAPLTEIVYGRG